MKLHDDDERKRSFGLDARAYNAARPRYPDALVERVVAHARITPTSTALEIGSGTGMATLPFARLGCSILCLELSETMAAVARTKLAAFPRVAVQTIAFDDWAGERASFDLVFCAQAWHWLSPDTRCVRTSRLLRAGGTLAVFANWDAAVLEEVQSTYARHGVSESGYAWARHDSDVPDIDAAVAAARA